LSYEIWENVFNAEDSNIDNMFNTFANTYLQIFYACFPKTKIYEQSPPKQWLTNGLKSSCKRKKEFYLLTKANDNDRKQYYKLYSKILTKVINVAKRLNYNDKIINSNNTAKTSWNIIKAESGKNRLNDKNCNTVKINPNTFNSHFLNSANIIQKHFAQITSNTDNNSNYKHYLNLTAEGPFPNLNFNKITTKEIE
jgi:hypothetical protein